MMTATALLALADQGRCRLDDPTGQYLPGEVVDRFHDRTGRAYAAVVALRQLLDHTSGLPNFFSQPPILTRCKTAVDGGDSPLLIWSSWRWPGSRRPRPQARPAPTPTPASCWPGSSSKPLTGRPLQAVYRELVLDPAGMADTWLESSDEPPRRRAIAPHEFDGLDITGMDPTVDWAGGGLVSTAADLAAFLRALARALVSMVVSHVVMVALMVAAPLHMDHHGHGLGAVGTVISLHVLGMYALAPLSGYLTDRYGSRRVLVAGVLTVGASAIVLVGAAHPSQPWFAVALFTLGYGWSMTIVGGSALLVRDVPATEQLRVQGGVEARMWGAAAFATFTSTQLLALGGFQLLATACVTLVAVSLLPILRTRIAPDRHAPDRAIMPHRRSR